MTLLTSAAASDYDAEMKRLIADVEARLYAEE
jgi:hypothetical protein